MINYELIEKLNIEEYISSADSFLSNMGFTEHNLAHLSRVSEMTKVILKYLDFDEHYLELAEIACYMHDIGNVINRHNHAHSGAIMTHSILLDRGYELSDVLSIMAAIGNHDEHTGVPVSPMSAALIIADKSDVRRSRVRKSNTNEFDIHDRVNYAVSSSKLDVDNGTIFLTIDLDRKYCSIVDYLEIFGKRMQLCKKSAKYLGLNFRLIINNINYLD